MGGAWSWARECRGAVTSGLVSSYETVASTIPFYLAAACLLAKHAISLVVLGPETRNTDHGPPWKKRAKRAFQTGLLVLFLATLASDIHGITQNRASTWLEWYVHAACVWTSSSNQVAGLQMNGLTVAFASSETFREAHRADEDVPRPDANKAIRQQKGVEVFVLKWLAMNVPIMHSPGPI